MKFSDRHKRDIEEFKRLLPYLNQLIHKVQLTNKPKVYHFNKADFIMRLNGDIIEMSLIDEAPIFPTLAFREFNSAKSDLLYYRIGQDFRAKLLEIIE
jgi:hypothetical protein